MVDLKREVYDELTGHIMPFWIKLKDKEQGGFIGKVDYLLNTDKSGDKGGIAASRLLWSFSAAYRVTGNKEYLDCANHAYEFLTNKVYDHNYKGLFWMLDYKGNPKDTRKHIYAQAFGIYGLSEYYRVAKNTEALDYAKKLYQIIETKGFSHERNAYLEEFDCQWNKKDNEMLSENGIIADITTNTHLHILEAYTTLYLVWPDKQLKDRLTNLIDIFYEKIYNKDTKYLKVFFNDKWEEIISLKSFGHDIEASWLIDDAIKLLQLEDKRYIQMVIDIAYNIADNAIQLDGSIVNEDEKGYIDYTRVWWGQVEAIIGFVNAYERTTDERFLNIAKNLWDYTKKNIIDHRVNGEWFWSVSKDGEPTHEDIAGPWKTPYHNGRFCLEIIERVR